MHFTDGLTILATYYGGTALQLRGFTPDASNLLVKTSVGSNNHPPCYFLDSLGSIGTKAIFIAGKDSMDISSKTASNRSKSHRAVTMIIVSAMMLALALVLEGVSKLIPFLKWPNGGSISVTMVPLVLAGMYCGPLYGTFVGVAFGVINFFMDGVIGWTPNVTAVLLSLLLDYIVGFGACGLGGLFRRPFYKKEVWAPFAALALACVVRFASSFISGVVVFTSSFDYDATSGLFTDFSPAGLLYSFTYNIGYILPSMVMGFFVLAVLAKPLFIAMDYPIFASFKKEYAGDATSGFVLPAFEKLMPLYLSIEYLFGILASIPSLKLSFLGYFGLVLGVALVAFEVVNIVKAKKNTDGDKNLMLSFIYLGLAFLGLGLSLAGVLSPATYGNGIYYKPEE